VELLENNLRSSCHSKLLEIPINLLFLPLPVRLDLINQKLRGNAK